MRRCVLAPLALCYLVAVTGLPGTPDALLPPNGNYRETIVGTGGAGTSITLHYQRGADARFTVTRGPIRTSYGTYRGADWHQDATASP
jgi:hypothetical protein